MPQAFALANSPDADDIIIPSGQSLRTVRTILVWLAIWFAPLALVFLMLGPDHRLLDIGLFFAKLAAVTFGGAYALLAWLAQAAVESKGWLQPHEMVDGLGLAETTPGPTILVTQFVGFLAASQPRIGRHIGGAAHDMDDLCAVFSLDLFACALSRAATVQSAAFGFARGDCRHCCWGGCMGCFWVWAPCFVR